VRGRRSSRSRGIPIRALIAAIPDPFKRSRGSKITGELPNPLETPTGCGSHPRCRQVRDLCRAPPAPDH
ncbi:oligopeptide/dipeptide ABC transporter ATP-binding protein, partial [Acinetobacter baumannii]|uniref:oligopeptide/dipeptide ABC transporter ATP-binding protein n=1 Tax=Acinetobacter baumannii TaxID=470 RepID=UPI0034D78E8D